MKRKGSASTYCCRDVFMFLTSEFSALALHPRAPELEYAAMELEAWPTGSHAYVLSPPMDSTLQNFVFVLQNHQISHFLGSSHEGPCASANNYILPASENNNHSSYFFYLKQLSFFSPNSHY